LDVKDIKKGKDNLPQSILAELLSLVTRDKSWKNFNSENIGGKKMHLTGAAYLLFADLNDQLRT